MSAVQQQPSQQAHEERAVSQWQRFITLALFWGAFLSFLAVSIPHVAWLYQTYEPKDGSWYTLVTTYGVAVGIDVMIAWLSWVQVAGKGARSGVTWVFIVALSFLSWYANYLYGMNNDPIHQADIWSISLAWGITTTGYITPVIISAVPLFSLAYTAMLHTVMNQKVETIEEMRTRLQDLRERKEVEQELKQVQGGGFADRIIGAAQAGKDTVVGIKKVVSEEQVQPKMEVQAEVMATSDGSDRLEQTIIFLQQYPDATDEQIADHLGMKRPASARFWRLKAGEMLMLNRAQKVEVKMERITSPLAENDGSNDGRNAEVEVEETTTLFEEVSEELFDNSSIDVSDDASETQTDPEVEVIDIANVPSSGSDSGNKISTVSIATRRKPMTISEVARELECSERHVRGLRAQGKLLEDEADKNLIKAASVRAYKSSKRTKVS